MKEKKPLVCRNCGQSATALMCLAMMEDLGARASHPANLCDDGEPHDFTRSGMDKFADAVEGIRDDLKEIMSEPTRKDKP